MFGFQPNQPGSQIPGSAIGYMPQELAVYEDFTIKETLWYFGRLYRIPSKVIKERIEFLLTFLDLPRSKRLIVNMSGGQKRRVSLASALVHSPPLLILDEPTVGVDPLLRQSIWQHLVTLTQSEKITVIVTTHYIEEARRANIVGLMRRGKLLAENTPEHLMAKHDSHSLEDVFLKLCVSDTMRRAQKFASLTGIPVQAAITGNNSVIPTPEIQSKRVHTTDGKRTPTVEDKTVAATSDDSFSGAAGSQSPDEGVGNNCSNNCSESSTNSLGGGDYSLEQQAQEPPGDGDKLPATGAGGGGGGGQQSSNVSPTQCSSVASDATTLDAGSLVNQAPENYSTLMDHHHHQDHDHHLHNHHHHFEKNNSRGDQVAAAAAAANTKPSRKFQLKSLLKFGAGTKEAPSAAAAAATAAEMKAAEKRRQSGSYFLEQLMSKAAAAAANQNQVQQDYHQPQQSRNQPINQVLRCDTQAGHHDQQPQQQQQQLSVPKISVHRTYGDSGASSNGSSQNHSPIGQRDNSSSSNNNNVMMMNIMDNHLMAASYQNHSYQPSECGSTTFNDLALITNNNGMNATSAGIINNNNNKSAGANSFAVNIQQQYGTDMNDLDDDIMLDPKLFMNPADLSTMSPGNKYDYKKQSAREYCDTIGTITWKNYIRLKRNVPLLLFQFVLPAIQVILFCICVGNDPFDIPVAVVNEESSADSIAALSSQFLRSVDTHLVRQVNFTNLEAAIESVRAGKNWGVVHIPENFTISIHKRFAGLEGELDDSTLENSTIKVYPDMTNQPIGHAMDVAFRRAYNDLSKQTFEFLGLNPALSDPPIRMENAIYGKIDMQNYLQYMSPGVLISISYIMATGLTSLAFIIERRDGLYDRTLAAGVGHVQMLLSHSIVQLVVMVVQISLVVFFTFVIYKVPTNGPFVWVFLLLLLQGLAGMSFGLMVSAICKEENTAIMMILGTFYPNLLLAGVIWPIEAIPHWLRWFSYLQPQTLPTQSLRDLIVRGWDIDQPGVWSGFAVTSIWLLLFLAISCIAFKVKK